jgi:hypothetical protein
MTCPRFAPPLEYLLRIHEQATRHTVDRCTRLQRFSNN